VLRHPIPRSVIMLLPVAICAGRMHFQTAANPGSVTQEVNRCLTMVRVAVTRRGGAPGKTRAPIARRAEIDQPNV
jgi:hypothetical protein